MIRWIIAGAFFALVGSVAAQKTSPWSLYDAADGLADSACVSVQIGSRDKIWVTHPTAHLASVLDGYSVKTVSLPAQAERGIFESPGGQLWVVVPEGLAERTMEGNWITHAETNISAFKAKAGVKFTIPLLPVRPGLVLFLLPDRLLEYDQDRPGGFLSRNLRGIAETRLKNFLALSSARDGGVWIIGERGIAKTSESVRSINERSIWNEYLTPSAIKLKAGQSFHEDVDGGFTVLGESDDGKENGVWRFDGKGWQQLPPPDPGVRFVWRGSNHEDWTAGKGALYQLKENRWQPMQRDEFSGLECIDAVADETGAFWLATSDGLFRHAPALWQTPTGFETFLKADLNAGKNPAGAVVIGQLRDGRSAVSIENILHLFDGQALQPFPYPLPPADSTNGWSKLFQAENGDIWLGSERLVAWFHSGRWELFNAPDKSVPDGAVGFIELNEGIIWCATRNKIWEFNGRSWITRRSGFDHIHCLLRDRNGTVWVGCNDGVHQFYHEVWLVHGVEEGLPGEVVRELSESSHGVVLAQSSGGLSIYHPDADRDAPTSEIQPLTNARIPEGVAATVNFKARDKWKQTPVARLLFSHRLDESDWSEFEPSTTFLLSDLPAGDHTLQVRSVDRNGNIESHPARLKFAVALPWFKEARLVLIASAGASVALFFGFLAYNRHRKLVLSHAVIEEKIAQRTKELELAHRELLHSQKMNAMGALASGIAHDFNNILSIIKGSVQIIEENFDDQSTVQSRLERIKTMVNQGSGVVKAMLGFTRADSPSGPQDLNELTAETIKLLGDRFLREVAIQLDCDPALPRIVVSREFIQQILLNLIFNASEAVTDRKKIVITTRVSNELPAGMVLKTEAKRLSSGAHYVLLSVQDFGCGIAPEILSRIFEPFFTTKAFSTRRGTGLGLSMVYNLAQKMNAGLAVESVVGSGSTFTLILPWSAETQSQAATEPLVANLKLHEQHTENSHH